MTDDERDWIAAARAAWPAIELDEARFVAEVTARLAGPDERRTINAADLWLTLACADGDPAALAAFDHRYLQTLGAALTALGLSADQIEETKQVVRERLLVASDGSPRIADFSGRADLRTWVRTVAVRAAIDGLRRVREVPIEDEEQLEELPAVIDDPELSHFKQHYREELRSAIQAAVELLEPRERLLLKSHYIDGLGVEALGALFGVHTATAARWLNGARDALAAHAQRLLHARLGVSPSELRSIARLVESQLDLSIRRLLA